MLLIRSCSTFSEPLSYVIVSRIVSGNNLSPWTMARTFSLEVLADIRIIIMYWLSLSFNTHKQSPVKRFPSIRSDSQSPNRSLLATISGLSCMETRLGILIFLGVKALMPVFLNFLNFLCLKYFTSFISFPSSELIKA